MTRNRDGTFAKGNPGGPGRPRRAVEADYLRVLSEACPPEVWADICRRAVEDARSGDRAARDWLARHLIGDRATLRQSLTHDEAMLMLLE